MKCRTFGIRLEQPFAAIDEAAVSEFMESVRVRKVTAGVCGVPAAWSVLVFFEDTPEQPTRKAPRLRTRKAGAPAPAARPVKAADAALTESPCEPVLKDEKAGVVETGAPVELTREEAGLVEAIKAWRSAKASEERIPPYCIVQNRSIEDIARAHPSSAEELAGIKGLGPSRIDKYGVELIGLVASGNGSHARKGSTREPAAPIMVSVTYVRGVGTAR
jgi:hypothetical protein